MLKQKSLKIIPKMDLESKKSFNPYYHPIDNKRIDFWRDFVNLCYGFTNPKDPSKEQTLQGSKKEKELFKDYEALGEQTFYPTKTTLKVTKINKYKLLLTKIAI